MSCGCWRRPRTPSTWPTRSRTPTAAMWCPPLPAWARPTGTSNARGAIVGLTRGCKQIPHHPGHPGQPVLPGQRRAARHGGGFRHPDAQPAGGRRRFRQQLPAADHGRHQQCAGQAAQVPSRPPPWAPPIWRAWPWATGNPPGKWPATGRWTAPTGLPSPKKNGPNGCAAGTKPSAAPITGPSTRNERSRPHVTRKREMDL